LIETLQTKPAKFALARQEAAKGLGLLGGEKSVNALISALESSEYPLRPIAASALGDTKDSRALEALRQVLNHPHKELRENAQEAIGKIEAQTDLARSQE
jgi:HEAT repeat protein